MLKRILALFTALCLLCGCAAAETAVSPETAATPETAARQIGMKTYPFYLFTSQETWPEEFPLYFADGAADFPFVELADWAKLLNWLYPKVDPTLFGGYEVRTETDKEHGVVLFIRENSHYAAFDFQNKTIFWDDFMGFLRQTTGAYIDISGFPPEDEEGRPFLLNMTSSRDRYGDVTELHLADYDIPMIAQEGKYLVPLQTLSAFFTVPYQVGFFFNQEALFVSSISDMADPEEAFLQRLAEAGLLTEEMILEVQASEGGQEEKMAAMMENALTTEIGMALFLQFQASLQTSLYPLYAAGPKGKRSQALTDYGFQELCLELDSFYGLKDAHNIKDFFTLFLQTGLMSSLLDPDAGKADSAIAELTQYWLDDGHSGFNSPSYLAEEDPSEGVAFGVSMLSRDLQGQAANRFRAAHPEAGPGYYETGNTAYVTFDLFSVDGSEEEGLDYYAMAEKDQLPDDTLGLIIKAHRQITRENSPIENVVLDLSCNGGGAAPAAIFTLGWFLGEAPVSMQNSFTGSETTTLYRADVNLDHQFDEKDTLSHLNLYCLISPSSFSCGNLVPWAFKADGRVTLLGKVSGGGACVVQHMTTAWGTTFQISGIKRISFTKNGAYYDVDRGVEPDYIIRSYDHFYDREALTKFINGLY